MGFKKGGPQRVVFLTVFLISSSIAFASSYDVNVTRKDSNLYEVTRQRILIFTRYCYEYVYYSDAVLKMSGRTGELLFTEEDATCDVKGVYSREDIDEGRYGVTVTHESDDWYQLLEIDGYIRTSTCLSLAILEEATLVVDSAGSGMIYFSDNEECMVDGIYTQMSL